MPQKLIVLDDNKTLLIETAFSEEELDEVAEKIQDAQEIYMDMEGVIKEMAKKNYLKIIGPGPEVLDVHF